MLSSKTSLDCTLKGRACAGAPLARSSCSWSCNWQPSQLVVGKDLYTFDSSRFLREKMPVEVDWDHRIKDRIESPPEIREDTAEEGEPDDSGALECIKRQYQPSNIIRKRRHGFLVRLRTRGGRNVLYRRYQKGRFVPSA